MNWAVVAPTGTVTDAGTVNPLVFVAVSAITAPPAGAAVVSVTVAVLVAPPVRIAGFSATLAIAAGGFTVKVAVLAAPL